MKTLILLSSLILATSAVASAQESQPAPLAMAAFLVEATRIPDALADLRKEQSPLVVPTTTFAVTLDLPVQRMRARIIGATRRIARGTLRDTTARPRA